MKLERGFYLSTDTARIARRLLGKLLVVSDGGLTVSGMITETEAYLGADDRAAHSYGSRRTPRNEVMYGAAGYAYVFFVYGMYNQFNVVCGPAGHPHAILIRAVEPVGGIDTMRERRGPMKDSNLTSGPGKLCIAMGIDRTLNGADLTGDRVSIEEYRSVKTKEIATGRRVGIDYAGVDAELPLRFWIRGNENVSKPRIEIPPKS